MSLDESAIDTLSVGEQLQQARTAMQLGITDVAQHLKLSALQIERLENNDFSTLGLVFSRGFVRQYARLVGLDADMLVAAMTSNKQQAESISVHNEQIPLSQGLSKYWLILVVTAVGLVVGVPLGIYYWLSSDTPTVTVSKVATPSQKTITNSIKTITPPVPAKAELPVDNAATTNTQSADTSDATISDIGTGRLSFKFDSDSWVEIRDANKRMILSHLYRAGETSEISGKPPLSLVIGNAAKVSLQYNDQLVDLQPYTGVTVARITLK